MLEYENAILSFTIENKPSWATFDTVTGELSGMPATADIGEYKEIQLSVNNGAYTSYLTPFEITVTAKPETPPIEMPPIKEETSNSSGEFEYNSFAASC